MDIEMTRVGPATVLVPKGELDMAAAEQVKRKLAELIDGGQTRLIKVMDVHPTRQDAASAWG